MLLPTTQVVHSYLGLGQKMELALMISGTMNTPLHKGHYCMAFLTKINTVELRHIKLHRKYFRNCR